MSPSYTEQQREAIESINISVAVTAGAGAGKTKVLVARYLELITKGGAAVDEIVAITFTNKAAYEMMERLRQAVEEMAASAPDEAALLSALALKEELAKAVVGTIHGFCGRLLREFPVEAGIDPRFEILDDLSSRQLLDASMQEELLAALDEQRPGLMALLEQFGFAGLADQVLGIYGELRNKGVTPQEMAAKTLSREELALSSSATAVQALEAGLRDLLSIDRKKMAVGTAKTVAILEERVADLLAMLHATGPNSEQAHLSACDELKGIRKGIRDKHKDQCKETIDPFLASLEQWACERATLPLLQALFSLLSGLDRRFRQAKAERQAMDFGDLEEGSLHLLREHPQVLEEVRHRYRYLMMDEFQDTNRSQEALMRLLVGDELAKRLFIVGDPKQSIYRFRGAEVALFEQVKQALQQVTNATAGKQLSRNFRTRAPIIAFINQLFGRLMGDHGLQYDSLEAHRQVADPDRSLVELLVAPTESGTKQEEALAAEAELLARRIRAMVDGQEPLIDEGRDGVEQLRPVRFGDMAILLRAMTKVKTFEEALLRYHIPYYVVDGRGFFHKQEIMDLLHVLRVINQRSDSLALWGWLRSPLVGIQDQTALALALAAGDLLHGWNQTSAWAQLPPDEQHKFQWAKSNLTRWRQLRSRVSVAELMEMVIGDSGWDQLLAGVEAGEQQLANLHKFVQMARQVAGSELYSLDDFLTYIEELRAVQEKETEAALEDERGDAVKLLTIHKAKGLEYGVVFVASIGQPFYSDDGAIRWHPELGVALKPPGEKGKVALPRLLVEVDEANALAERDENIRLLYVAATRARDYLVLSGCQHQLPADTEPKEAKHWLDWVASVLGCTVESIPEQCHCGCPVRVTATVGSVDEVLPPVSHWAPATTRAEDEASTALRAQIQRQLAPLSVTPRANSKLAVTPLLTYAHCPRSYYYCYRLRLQDTGWGLEIYDRREDEEADDAGIPHRSSVDALQLGSLVHQVCEQLHQSADQEVLLQIAGKQLGITDNEAGEQTLAEARLLLDRYASSSFFAGLGQARQSWAELPFLVELQPGLILEGVMDRVLEHEDGSITIIDFKTNQVGAGIERVAERYRLQMQLYALAAGRLFGRPVREAVLYFLRANQFVACPTGEQELARVYQEVITMGTHMEVGASMADFPADRRHCYLCGFRELCPDARRVRRDRRRSPKSLVSLSKKSV